MVVLNGEKQDWYVRYGVKRQKGKVNPPIRRVWWSTMRCKVWVGMKSMV